MFTLSAVPVQLTAEMITAIRAKLALVVRLIVEVVLPHRLPRQLLLKVHLQKEQAVLIAIQIQTVPLIIAVITVVA